MKHKFLSEKVKELRKRKGFSQEELSETSGLSLRTIQRIEGGDTEPNGETIRRISNALDVNPEELTDWTIIEDRGYLQALNLSALTFILFPLLGIITPLLMWLSKKHKLKDINKVGKSIINFQITWTILLFAGLILNILVLKHVISSSGEVSPYYVISSNKFYIIFLFSMYILNVIYILYNTFRIQHIKPVWYRPKINFV